MRRSEPSRLARAAVAALLLLGAAGALALERTPLPPPADRSVHDLAGVVTPEDAAAMERLHTELFGRTSVAIVVLVVPRLVNETIEELAVRAGHDRGAGRKGEDRGIVIALAVADRKIFVATGYGVEGYLPDGRVGSLIDRYAVPHFRDDGFSRGLRELSGALASASAQEFGVRLEGTPEAPPREARERGPAKRPPRLLVLLIAGFVIYMLIRHPRLLLLWLLTSGGGRGRRGGGGFGGFGGGGFGGGGAGRSF